MTAAGLACATCGTELRENAKFCDECAAPITLSHNPGEYKQVTVRFANVVRSMGYCLRTNLINVLKIRGPLVWYSSLVLGGEAPVAVHPFNGAIGANPDL